MAWGHSPPFYAPITPFLRSGTNRPPQNHPCDITVTEALLWRRWNHLKRCTMNGYINCELLKTYTTSSSTCGWSNTHVSMHENTTSWDDVCVEWEKPFHVERENGERKLWSGRQTIVRVRTVLESELPTTLTPELVLELRHTQRKPVSGRKPLRRLLSNPS